MEDSKSKVFTIRAISLATFIGGPISAGLLISKNYATFGNKIAARNSIIIGFLSTIIILSILLSIPESKLDKIPNSIFPLFYTTIVAVLVNKLQSEKIDSFLQANAKKASNLLAFGYGMFGTLISLIIILPFILFAPYEGYESKVKVTNNVNLYYNNMVRKEYAEGIAVVIRESKFLEGSETVDLFLSDETDFYKLKFVVNDTNYLRDKKFIYDIKLFEEYLNGNYKKSKPVTIGFTDNNLIENYVLKENSNTERILPKQLRSLQRYSINSYHTLYYDSKTPLSDIKKVEDSIKRLKGYFPENKEIDIIFIKNKRDYTIKFFVSKDLWNNPAMIERTKNTVEYIKNNGIEKNIEIILVDQKDFDEKEL